MQHFLIEKSYIEMQCVNILQFWNLLASKENVHICPNCVVTVVLDVPTGKKKIKNQTLQDVISRYLENLPKVGEARKIFLYFCVNGHYYQVYDLFVPSE